MLKCCNSGCMKCLKEIPEMTTEKSLGEVVATVLEDLAIYLSPGTCNMLAKAVIKEFCERNGKTAVTCHVDFDGSPLYERHMVIPHGAKLFLSPQPMVLPSVEEIRAALVGTVQKGDLTTDYAEAILKLLKEKNKNG